jgi:hypothetical protein
MKRKFTLFLAAVTCAATIKAQVTLSENFTAPFSPAASGWFIQNNSVPQGTVSWFQGNAGTFAAFNGAAADYYAVNFQSQGATAGGISNWLVTPTVNLTNGGVFNFATRTTTSGPGTFPDRLQVRYSIGTGTGAIGAGTTAVGTFTDLIADINPSLTLTGYPANWTVYSLTLTSVIGVVPGRFAFRYFVDDGGANGNNSDYIGIDAVNYTFPCAQPTIVISPSVANVCSGVATTLTAVGAVSYTWNTGATTSTISVSPSVTTIYSVTGVSGAGCPATATAVINVTTTPTVSVLNATTCAGSTATLQASGASSYSWQPGGETTSSIAVTPTASSVYTVTGTNGSCSDTKTVSVTIGPNLGINVSASSPTICSGQSTTITASGASQYSWAPGGQTTSVIVVSPGTTTTYTVAGLVPPSCMGGNTIAITVNASPTVAGGYSPTPVCIGADASFTLTGTGAVNYSWSIGPQTFTNNPQVINTPTAGGIFTFSLTGQAINGCSNATPVMVAVTITNCATGIDAKSAHFDEVSVFPNPFSNELKITGFNGQVKVYNALGQLVISAIVNESETLNTSALQKGIYFVKTYSADGNITKTVKVIKN